MESAGGTVQDWSSEVAVAMASALADWRGCVSEVEGKIRGEGWLVKGGGGTIPGWGTGQGLGAGSSLPYGLCGCLAASKRLQMGL